MEFSLFNFLFGISLGAFFFWIFYTMRLGSFRQHALLIVRQAESESEQKKADIALELQKLRQTHDQQIQQEILRLETQELQLKSQGTLLAKDIERFKKEQARFSALQKELNIKEIAINDAYEKALDSLAKTAQLSFDEARAILFQKAREESKVEIERQKVEWQKSFQIECEAKTAKILVSALERKSPLLTKDLFLSQVLLSNRSLIPKIIGKEGRNIQMLEALLQVSVLIDEQAPCLFISSHNAKARYIATKTIEQLIEDEKITPVTIRATHEKALASMARFVEEEGRAALQNCKNASEVAPEVASALGNLFFCSSNGQNVLRHSIEVSEMMGILAAELGLNCELSKLMGLFHDIGKGLTSDWGQGHSLAGKNFLEKWGVDAKIANAVAAHHGEVEPITEEARLVPICDRLSAELPGIRQAQENTFLALVKQCETLSKAVPGVLSAWAHYGGNHIEVVIRHAEKADRGTLTQALTSAADQLPIPVLFSFL